MSSTDHLTLILFDADFSSNETNKKPFILWQMYFKSFKKLFYFYRNNFRSENEVEILPYCPASPERGSGIHRIIGLIIKNPNSKFYSSDRFLNLNELVHHSGEIISYNFFLTIWTKSVSDHLKALNCKERIFGEFIVGPGQSYV